MVFLYLKSFFFFPDTCIIPFQSLCRYPLFMTTLICAINKVRIGVFNTKIVCENGGGERKKHTRAEIYIVLSVRACVRA